MSVTLASKAVISSIHLFNQKRALLGQECSFCTALYVIACNLSLLFINLVKLLTGDKCTVCDYVLIEKLNATYRVSNY